MADEKQYTIPLRKEWLKLQRYRRAGRAAKAIKEYIARHMKVPDRDTNKIKLDVYSNMQLWKNGRTNPPSKVKVRAIKEGDVVKVELLDIQQAIKFKKIRHEKLHKKEEKKSTPKPAETKQPEKTQEEVKEEKEKEQSVAQAAQEAAHQTAKQQKHTQIKQAPKVQRKALKK